MDMMHAMLIALLQGVTELFPVSSLGHAIIVPALLRWPPMPQAIAGLPFLVALHLATTIALVLFFWRDWAALLGHVLGRGEPSIVRRERRIAFLLIVATLPAIAIGAVAEHALRLVFAAPLTAAVFLIANGILLLACEALRRRMAVVGRRSLETLSIRDAALIGLAQCLAFLPGISRSGGTISMGLLLGLSHENSARFSFLLAPLIIGAATILQIIKLRHVPGGIDLVARLWLPGLVAGVAAFLSTAGLMKWFRDHDDWALWPFAAYCVLAGAGSAVVLAFVG